MASLPTTAAPQPASAPSFTTLFTIYLKALFRMMVPYTLFIVCAGIILRATSSANHIRHLASFWGFMTGASGASLLLGLCSARGHCDRTWTMFGRITLLVSFLGSISLGLMLLSKSDHASPSLVLDIMTAVSFTLTCCAALYMIDHAYVKAVTDAADQEAIQLADYTRWVAGIQYTIS